MPSSHSAICSWAARHIGNETRLLGARQLRHGQKKDYDEATTLAKCTIDCLRLFCTFMPGTKLERFQQGLFDHMRSHCEILNADGLQTAQLANEQLTNALHDPVSPEMPRARCSIDFTHGMRRVAERPFNAVPDVKAAVETMILQHDSIVQRTRHSPEFRDQFGAKAQEVEDPAARLSSKLVNNLSNAKHRFDTLLNPLRRWCILFEPLLVFADVMSFTRRGNEEGRDAERYLIYISGEDGLYRCCLVAGFTEFVKTLMRLIRFFDHEHWCASEVASLHAEVVHELYVLFIMKQAFDIPGTFANRLRETLRTVRSVVVRNEAYSIGARSAMHLHDAMAKAFEHLSALVALSISVLRAEIPEWSIYRSFAPFKIQKPLTAMELRTHLRRLSQVFELNFGTLQAEFARVFPCVQAAAVDQPMLPMYELWAYVVNHDCVDVPALRLAIMRLQTFSGNTTSGVEHVHSKQAWAFSQQRGCMAITTENDEMVILNDLKDSEVDTVIGLARELWKRLRSGHRHHTRPRCDSGTQKKKKGVFLRDMELLRESAVRSACSAHAAIGAGQVHARAFEQARDIWNEGMNAEVQFNSTKLVSKRLDALPNGELLAEDVGGWDVDLATSRVAHKRKLRDGRAKAAAKKRAKATARREPVTLCRGKHVYIMPCATMWGLHPSPREIIRSRECAEAPDVMQADVVVCAAPGALPFDVHWQCFLTGAIVTNHAALLGTQGGTYVTYNAAVRVGGSGSRGHRRVYLTDRFVAEHASLASSLRRAFLQPNVVWSEADQPTYAALVAANDRLPVRQRRDMQQIALVADTQAPGNIVQAPVGQMFSARMLVEKLLSFDASACAIGACNV